MVQRNRSQFLAKSLSAGLANELLKLGLRK
jgi:hypothetical protein